VQFDPLEFITGFWSKDDKGKLVTGTVVFVNEWGKWFSVEYGNKQRTSFKFCDIGKDVKIID
jgi:hypothetical protein